MRYKTDLFGFLVPGFLIVSPIFGFILAAEGCCCPGRSLERTIVLPENNVLVQALPHKTGQDSNDLGEN
jgi:hypothetical protein